MSNFKIYLQKAQGYDIDTAEIVSVNESFKSYLQKPTANNVYKQWHRKFVA